MSSSILHIIGYFLTKLIGSILAKTTILKLLDVIHIVDGSHDTAILALQNQNPDIEDALQYQIALKNKMDYFISGNKNFQKYGSVGLPIITISKASELFSK